MADATPITRSGDEMTEAPNTPFELPEMPLCDQPGQQLTAIVPDEPPRGSVVVDKIGLAWQHIDTGFTGIIEYADRWACACPPSAQPRGVSWTYLLAYSGPVILVHRGTGETR